MKWTEKDDDKLTELFCEGVAVKVIARHFGRTQNAIKMRIEKLELEELYGRSLK